MFAFNDSESNSPGAAGSERLKSPRMRGLAKDLESRYPDRYVFFDVAPVLAGADAPAFAPPGPYHPGSPGGLDID